MINNNKTTLADIGPFTFYIFFLVLLIQLLEKYIHFFQIIKFIFLKKWLLYFLFLFIRSAVMMPFPYPLTLVLYVFLLPSLLSVISLKGILAIFINCFLRKTFWLCRFSPLCVYFLFHWLFYNFFVCPLSLICCSFPSFLKWKLNQWFSASFWLYVFLRQ